MEVIIAIVVTSILFLMLMLFHRKQFEQRFANHSNLVSEIDKLSKESSDLETQLSNLTSKLNIANVELRQAEEAVKKLLSKQEGLLTQISQSESNLVKSKYNFNEFNQKLVALMQEHKITTSSHQTLTREFDRLRQEVSGAEVSLKALSNRTEHLQSLEKSNENMRTQEASLSLAVSSCNGLI